MTKIYFIFISTSSKYTNTPTYPIPKQGINYTDKRVLGEFWVGNRRHRLLFACTSPTHSLRFNKKYAFLTCAQNTLPVTFPYQISPKLHASREVNPRATATYPSRSGTAFPPHFLSFFILDFQFSIIIFYFASNFPSLTRVMNQAPKREFEWNTRNWMTKKNFTAR